MRLTTEKRPIDITGGHCGEIGGDAGHNEVQASHDCGRRWYHLRPNPRGDADLLGFNWSWWTVLVVLLLIL
jgi:hypothetical protein